MIDHKCPRCGRLFKQRSNLDNHLTRKLKCKIVEEDYEEEYEEDEYIINKEEDISFPDLERFSWVDKLKPDQCYSIILAAIRRSGKTTLIKYIYPLLIRDYDIVLFLSNSIHNSIYNFVGDNGFPDYHPQMIEDIMEFQESTNNMFRICIVMDDLVSYRKKNDESLMQLFVRGRNINVTIIVSSQSTTLINKNNRGNSDFVIIGNNPSTEFRETLIKAFVSGTIEIPKIIQTKSGKEEYYHRFLQHHTKEYGFLVIDNIDHEIYKYKTPIKK